MMREELQQHFRTLLETRKSELQSVIIGNEHILREQLSPDESRESIIDANHPADMISADPDYDKQIALIRRERAELALVTGALARLEQGTYGECESCHEDIPTQRLQAIPYTKYCISCREDKDFEAQGMQRDQGGANPHAVSNVGL